MSEITKDKTVFESAYKLAMLVLQSELYKEIEVKEAVDYVIYLTREVAMR